MFKFTITYYFDVYHTGEVNTNKARIGVVSAANKEKAVDKIKQVDKDFVCVADLVFEEMVCE